MFQFFKNKASTKMRIKPTRNTMVAPAFGGFVVIALVTFFAPDIHSVFANATTTFNPTADVHVRADMPTTNLGTETNLLSDGDPDSQVFFKFDLSNLADKTIVSAKIRVHVTNPSVDTHAVKVVSDTSWTESGMNYNNKPTLGSDIGSIVNPANNTWQEVDITSTVNSYKGSSLAFAIVAATGGDGVTFASKEHSTTLQPQLVVEHADPTSATLTAIADTYTDGSNPTTNYGTDTALRVDGDPTNIAFFKYDLSSLANKTITSAKARLYVTDGQYDGSAGTQQLRLVENTSWGESTLVHNDNWSRTTAMGQIVAPNAGTWQEVDITSYVNSYKGQTFSFAISVVGGTGSGDGVVFASKDASTNKPEIYVEFAPAPTPTPTPVSTTFNPNADVHVRADMPTTNLATEANLLSDGDPDSQVFFKFDLASLANNSITSAKLRVHVTNPSVDTHNVNVVSDTSWTETGMNYNNKPSLGSNIGSIVNPANGTWQEVDITSTVDSKKGSSLALAISAATGGNGDGVTLASKEHSTTYQPQLVVEHTAVAPTPTPTPQNQVVFAAVGDTNNDLSENSNMNKVLRGIGAAQPDFALGLGDYIYSQNTAHIQPWCQNLKDQIETGSNGALDGDTFPFELATGNHDDGTSDADIISIPNSLRDCLPHRINNINEGHKINGSAYAIEYSFDYPNVNDPLLRVITISPDIFGIDYDEGTDNYNFVKNSILEARDPQRTGGAIPWVVVAHHKNCVANLSKSCEIGPDLMNLLLGKNLGPGGTGYGEPVDLILEGHEHSYHRSKALSTNDEGCTNFNPGTYNADCVTDHDDEHSKGNGSILAIVGTGGRGLRVMGNPAEDAATPYFNAWSAADHAYPEGEPGSHGFGKFTVTEDQIIGEFIATNGKSYYDDFVISKNISPDPKPVYDKVVKNPVADSYVSAENPTTNYGTSTTIQSDYSPLKHAYMKFDLTDVDATSYIASAKLSLEVSNPTPNGYNIRVVNDNSWTESGINHNNRPTAGDIVARAKSMYKGNSGIDLTDLVNSYKGSVFTIEISPKSENSSDGVDIHSREASTGKPELIINIDPSIKTLSPVADTYTSADFPTTNYGSDVTMRVDGEPVSNAFLKYDLASLAGKSITSAKARFYVTPNQYDGSVGTQQLKLVENTSWNESTLVHNDSWAQSTVMGEIVGTVEGTWQEVDITDFVNTYKGQTLSFALSQKTGTGFHDAAVFASREALVNQPELVVEYDASFASVVKATHETDPVMHGGDAADDTAIYADPVNPEDSVIFGTNKQGGLYIYDMEGNELDYLPDGKINNVDIREGFSLNGQPVILVTGSNRTYNRIETYTYNPANQTLTNVTGSTSTSDFNEIYGYCMYQSSNGKVYGIGTDRDDGMVRQYELVDSGSGTINATKVREINVGSQSEGCVADDDLGHLYVGEEDEGVWKYGAEPNTGSTRTLVEDAKRRGGRIVPDVEGLTIFYTDDETGYLIVSNQGNNSYLVYEREGNNKFLAEFRITDGNGIDAVTDTDGIDVLNANLGPNYPHGVFIAQDLENDSPSGMQNQNFKLVPWEDIAFGGNYVGATVTKEPVADAYVSDASPTTNYGSVANLIADAIPSSLAYFKFDLADVTASDIANARLRLYVTNGTTGRPNVRFVSNNGWVESNINWNNKPSVSWVMTKFDVPNTNNMYYEADVTTAVYNTKGSTLTIAVENNVDNAFHINSREASSNKPQLVIDY